MSVRIGCYSAFWGDSITAASQLVHFGNVDYLVADYLAEVTMGILAKSNKNGSGGFIKEFITFVWKPLMSTILEKKIKLVTNAGGLNPIGLKKAIEDFCVENGVELPVVAAVNGDDLMPYLNNLNGKFEPFSQADNLRTSEVFPQNKKVESLNAYLGAEGIAKALEAGASIVITGRCVDSALVLGPLIYEHKWNINDYDLLAAGSLAGHIIECGCQATGGNFTDWKLSAFSDNGGWSNMGYPIVEVQKNGEFLVTKTDGTGGLVSFGTVAEQLIYEIGDPSKYILPDVIVDFRNVILSEVKTNVVKVSGVRGRAPTEYLKVSGIYSDGYKVTGELFIGGIEATEKAFVVGNSIVTKASKTIEQLGMQPFSGTNVEPLGSEITYGPNSRAKTKEIVLRLSASHSNRTALGLFLMEIPPSATCMAPGIIGVSTGRPKVQSNMVHFSTLISKDQVIPSVTVGKKGGFHVPFKNIPAVSNTILSEDLDRRYEKAIIDLSSLPMETVRLIDLCYGRSGDKGNSSNIGIIARKKEYYPWLRYKLTEEKVFHYMKHLIGHGGEVKRYDLPGIGALNFLLTESLGGGGLSSLAVDRQGKSYAQMLLSLEIDVPASWVNGSQKL